MIARILYKKAKVLENNILAGFEGTQLRTRAELARANLTRLGQGDIVQVLDENGNVDLEDNDDAYDALVPIFFR